jgi:phosphoribosyl 1,2-cyclic phosphodiesterase
MIRNLDLFRKPLSFANLGSGSKGNASVVLGAEGALLVDCGLSCLQIQRRLRKVGVEPERVRGILITHEHSDHVAGLAVTSRTLGVEAWMTPRCEKRLRGTRKLPAGVTVNRIAPGRAFSVGGLEVEAFRIPHDSIDPVGYVVGQGEDRVGFATDLGTPTDPVIAKLSACKAVLLEFNHDVEMLLGGEYPWSLKQRVRSELGHLSNRQAAEIARRLRRAGTLRHLVVGHVSEQNNTSELALAEAMAGLGSRAKVQVTLASQGEPTGLIRLD